MRKSVFSRCARILAVLAIAFQVSLPATLAVADASGVDVSQYMCAPSGEMSPGSRATVERLAKLLGEDPPEERSFGEHCPMCTFVHGAPVPRPATFAEPAVFSQERVFIRYAPGLVCKPQGPPLGSRGPPSHL